MNTTECNRNGIQRTLISHQDGIDFAGHIPLLVQNQRQMQVIEETSRGVGLRINQTKTRIL